MNNSRLIVLLIEDNEADARFVKEMLRSEPEIHVYTVDRLASGITYLSSNPVDIILLDLGLPDSQGLNSLTDIVKVAPHLPIIVVTGQEDENIAQGSINLGAQDYVTKPIASSQLFVRILRFAYERNRADVALKKNEAKYRHLYNSIRDGFVYVDMQGKILDCNEPYQNMLGYTFAEISQLTYIDITPDKWHAFEQNIVDEQILPKGFSDVYEKEYKKKDGSIFPVELRTLLLKKDTGENNGMWAIVRDITQRKKSEKILELRIRLLEYASSHSLAEFLQEALDEICIFTDSPIGFYHFVEPDEKTLSLQAWSSRTVKEFCTAEAKGMRYDIDNAGVWVDCLRERRPIIHNDYASLSHRKGMPSGHAVLIRELTVPISRSGRIMAIVGVGNKLTDYTNEDINIVSFLADVTWEIAQKIIADELLLKNHAELVASHSELKQAQSHIIQQEKMAAIGQLAAGIAHEINNPMSFVIGNIDILRNYVDMLTKAMKMQEDVFENVANKEELQTWMEKKKKLKIDFILEDIDRLINQALEGTDRVKRIVTDMRTFSRKDDDVCALQDINMGIESTINIVWNEIKYKAELVKEFGDLPLTACNINNLNQVFMNLLVNAAQAIEKRGKITVRTWSENNDIFVSIADTGSGILEENLSRIFDPFYTTKEEGKGTGLGLSISYDIVKRHYGDITVVSSIGKGTTFTVRIPIVRS